MKKWLIGVVIVLVLIVIGAVAGYMIFNKNMQVTANTNNQNTQNQNYVPVTVTKANLVSFLEAQNIIKDLPSDAVILLRFYNFDSGERAWEESYVIKKGKVEVGTVDTYDIKLALSSRYVSSLGDFCKTIQTANANNDLGIEYGLGQTALMWKYKSMMNYKSCFGM